MTNSIRNSFLLLPLCFVFLTCTLDVCGSELQRDDISPDNDIVTVFLVRHAEKQGGKDPELTKEGRQRAVNYANMLKDSGIKEVYTTDFKRTRATAAPVAKSLDVEPKFYDPRKLESFRDDILASKESCLIVGHSNTTHELTELLGGNPGEPIDEEKEYDRVYQLLIRNGKVVHTIVLRSSKR